MWPFRRKAADSRPLGPRGEMLARKFLQRSGMKILAQNYRCPVGEADLIALDHSTRSETGAETIAFVEVKTRSSDRHTDPASAVNSAKRRQMRRVAEYYLNTHDTGELNARLDVVSIVIDDDEPRIEYIPDAF